MRAAKRPRKYAFKKGDEPLKSAEVVALDGLKFPSYEEYQLSPKFGAHNDITSAHGKPTSADVEYNETLAKAFADLSKTALCGCLPGVYAAASSVSTAQKAGFSFESTGIFPFKAAYLHVEEAVTGYVAKGKFLNKDICVLAFRSTVDNYENLFVDLDSELDSLPSKYEAPTAKVHQGWWKQYQAASATVKQTLITAGCSNVPLALTGFGTGGSLAALAAFDLAFEGCFKFATSYVFHALKFGNEALVNAFLKYFNQDKPFYFVTELKDKATATLPSVKDYHPNLYEVHYTSATEYEVCYPGQKEKCGVAKYNSTDLTDTFCKSGLVSEGDFCKFKDPSLVCYGGQDGTPGFGVGEGDFPADWPRRLQDDALEMKAQALDLTDYDSPSKLYNEKVAKCFANLGRALYCNEPVGKRRIINDYSAKFCEPTGAKIEGDSARFRSFYDFGVADALNVAVVRITKVPPTTDLHRDHPWPEKSCMVIFRGAQKDPIKKANRERSSQADLEPIPFCPDGHVHSGFLEVWNSAKGAVIQDLHQLGCSDPSSTIFVNGFSFGSAVGDVAFASLARTYTMGLSYFFGALRTGDDGYSSCLYKLTGRKTNIIRVNFERDPLSCAPPAYMGFTSHQPEVYYYANGKYELCEDGNQYGCSNSFDPDSGIDANHVKCPLAIDGELAPGGGNSEYFYERCAGYF